MATRRTSRRRPRRRCWSRRRCFLWSGQWHERGLEQRHAADGVSPPLSWSVRHLGYFHAVQGTEPDHAGKHCRQALCAVLRLDTIWLYRIGRTVKPIGLLKLGRRQLEEPSSFPPYSSTSRRGQACKSHRTFARQSQSRFVNSPHAGVCGTYLTPTARVFKVQSPPGELEACLTAVGPTRRSVGHVGGLQMATRLHNNHLKSKDDGNKEVDNSPPARAMPAESGRGALGGNQINNS
jgi:hypothetical protein